MTGGEIVGGKLHYIVDVPGDLIIDKRGLIQPLPTLYHSTISAEFDALFLEKLSTINLVQAVSSYIGYLHGYRYVHEAVMHHDIVRLVKAAAAEATAAFKVEFPHLSAGIDYDVKEAITRISDPGLGDTIARICKGPQRKLAS
jgi:mannitol-1-phosphate/altronate dehydrogenase